MEEVKTAVSINNFSKKFKGFTLDVPCLKIPQGFATALIGENGAGKTTLLNALAGVRLDYKGNMEFFGQWDDKERENADCPVKEMIGYVGPNNYYLPQWTVKQVEEITDLLYQNFDCNKFENYIQQLQVATKDNKGKGKKVNDLSDGNRMKLMLSGVFARETQMLLLDEPASPLDPLMRDVLCDMIRGYLEEGAGEKDGSFFHTQYCRYGKRNRLCGDCRAWTGGGKRLCGRLKRKICLCQRRIERCLYGREIYVQHDKK